MYGIAILLASKKFRPEQVDLESRTWLLCSFIAVEALCAAFILYVITEFSSHLDVGIKSPDNIKFWINLAESISYIAMLILAFLHGLITTHFLTLKPTGVTREQQPQAYAERDYMRHFGIFLGIIVQLLAIILLKPCFFAAYYSK